MADYILKKIDNELWKKVKKLAIDKNTTVKGLIVKFLEDSVSEHNKKCT